MSTHEELIAYLNHIPAGEDSIHVTAFLCGKIDEQKRSIEMLVKVLHDDTPQILWLVKKIDELERRLDTFDTKS